MLVYTGWSIGGNRRNTFILNYCTLAVLLWQTSCLSICCSTCIVCVAFSVNMTICVRATEVFWHSGALQIGLLLLLWEV